MFNFLIKFLWKFYVNVLFYVSGLVKYDLMRASSYLPLLKELKAKHVCLNIQNNVKKSFLWSILASLHSLQYRNHLAGVWKYHEYEHELNMSGIQYPVDIKHIGKFEHQNNISVKYMSTKIKKIFPLLITTMAVPKHHVNLLYITADEKPPHVLVKDLSRLISNQYNNHKGNTFFCQYCLHSCTSEDVLKKHLERCKLHRVQRIKLPEAEDKMGRDKVKFTKADYQLRLSFVIYADFKSPLCKQDWCEPSSSKFFTTQYQHHVPCGSCI